MTLPVAYVNAVMADSPWGFWDMQESAGATAMADSSGNSHGGTYDAALATTTGPFSGWTAAQFNPGSAVVAGVYSTGGTLAIEFWFCQRGSATPRALFDYANSTATQGVILADQAMTGCGINGAIAVHAPSSGWICVPSSPTTVGAWYHCVLQHESDNHWRWYIRGTTNSTHVVWDLGAASMTAPSSPGLYIGRWANTSAQMIADTAAWALYTTPLTVTRMDAHYDAASYVLPPGCIYGSHAKVTSPYTAIAEDYLLQKILSRWHLEWMSSLIYYALGEHVDVNYLCSLPPPVPPPLDAGAFLNAGKYSIPWLHRLLWDEFCECNTGPLGKPDNPPIDQAQPAGWFVYSPITVNATNPCLDITDVRRMLQVILQAVSSDVRVDVQLQQGLLPTATSRGATSSGLTGSGSFAVSNAIGVQVVITARPPGGRELEGAPPYIWDAGWLSIMDGNGFIQERRLTRDVEVWMPRLMSDAITFGYFFKDGVTADVTVLYASA